MINNKISAIVTTYNRGEVLSDCVGAMASQIFRPIEIVIVDDGSTDNTCEIVKQLQSELDISIKYIRQSNAGPSEARNAGFDAAIGDYVACCDDDDLWHPQHLEWVNDAINLFPDARVFSGYIGRDFSEKSLVKSNNKHYFSTYVKVPNTTILYRKKQLLKAPFYTPCFSTVVIHSDIIRKIRVDKDLQCREDIDFFWRISEVTDIVLDERIHAMALQLPISHMSVAADADENLQLELQIKRGYWGVLLMQKTVDRYPDNRVFKKLLAQDYLGYAHYLYIARRDKEARFNLVKSIKSALIFNQIKLILRMLFAIRPNASSVLR
ncbi:glycosyltransferase family 2 protein [Neptunomonas antarctica]|uniref:Glycosyltransferase involved in cell wall bisynthesis n=1 Tax=Neptunomonas antarctica TaxID=619304 RepID=A0A1N7JEM9_9GAMM|nr:glycosyltransferase family 2 protein [Neptunomonas antarctica]SIS47760.1 Glycosyltransferase involved in cell wall bisynthesis [Neptunomonas antarctica]